MIKKTQSQLQPRNACIKRVFLQIHQQLKTFSFRKYSSEWVNQRLTIRFCLYVVSTHTCAYYIEYDTDRYSILEMRMDGISFSFNGFITKRIVYSPPVVFHSMAQHSRNKPMKNKVTQYDTALSVACTMHMRSISFSLFSSLLLFNRIVDIIRMNWWLMMMHAMHELKKFHTLLYACTHSHVWTFSMKKSHTNFFWVNRTFHCLLFSQKKMMNKYCSRKCKVCNVKFCHSKLRLHRISFPSLASSRRAEKR